MDVTDLDNSPSHPLLSFEQIVRGISPSEIPISDGSVFPYLRVSDVLFEEEDIGFKLCFLVADALFVWRAGRF